MSTITLSRLFADEFVNEQSDFTSAVGALAEALAHTEWVDELNASPAELALAVSQTLTALLNR